MMVVDRNEKAKVIFNVNFKSLSSLIKSVFVGERTLYIYIYIYEDKGLHAVDEVRVKCLPVWRETQYPPREL